MKGASSEQADTAAFGFDSEDDVRDFVRGGHQDWDDRQSSYRFDWAERYKEGQLEIVLKVHPKGDGEVRDLVFRAVPFVRVDRASGWKAKCFDIGVSALQSDAGDEPVLTYVAQPVEYPNGVSLPTLVRFERPKKRHDVRWDIFTAASAYHVCFELRAGIGDREISGFGFPFAGQDGGSIPEVVQRGSHVLDSLDYEEVENGWNWPNEAAFVHLTHAIRIRLNDEGV